jgi:hypothetical protein
LRLAIAAPVRTYSAYPHDKLSCQINDLAAF